MFNLPTYRGFAQDNLTSFINDLMSYYSVKNIDDNNRKVSILHMQLRHAAKIFTDTEAAGQGAPINFK